MRLLLAIAMLTLLPAHAHAMRVRNADNVPHTLTLHYLNDSWSVTLTPNGRIDRPLPGIVLEYGGAFKRTKADEEYMIQNGVLSLNRRNCCGMGRSH